MGISTRALAFLGRLPLDEGKTGLQVHRPVTVSRTTKRCETFVFSSLSVRLLLPLQVFPDELQHHLNVSISVRVLDIGAWHGWLEVLDNFEKS